jgi:hypothetical protein
MHGSLQPLVVTCETQQRPASKASKQRHSTPTFAEKGLSLMQQLPDLACALWCKVRIMQATLVHTAC